MIFQIADRSKNVRSLEGRDSSTDSGTIRECWVENVYRVEPSHLRGNPVLDLGANIGAFATFAAGLGATRVIAVEPEQSQYDLLVKNAEQFRSAIQPRRMAVWDRDGTVEIYPDEARTSIYADSGTLLRELFEDLINTTPHRAIVNAPQSVPCMTLQSLLRAEKLSVVDVMKLDVEGAEFGVIESTPSEVLAKIGYIAIECHPTDGTTFGKLVAKLTLTHHVETLGRHDRLSYIYARAYG